MWWIGLALAVAAGLTASLTSHSAALREKEALAVIADAAHVLAAGAWVGGLVQLVLATRLTRSMPLAVRQALNLRLVLNFSTMAAIAVGLLLVSGGYLVWRQVGSWAALFNTAYGQVLLAKSGLALPAFATASLNLMVIRPQLEAARQLPGLGLAAVHRRFGRLVQMEAGFALAVVAAAGLLTDLQPGRDALLVAEQSRMTASQPTDDLNVRLTIEPGQWGQFNTFDVYVLDVERQPVTDVREVSLRFSFLDRPMGTNTVTAKLVGGGHYRATGSYLSLGGGWQAEVAVRRPQAYDTYAAFELATTPEGVIRPLNASGAWDRFVTWLDGAGGWLVEGALCLLSLAWVVPAVWANAGRVTWALAVSLLPSLVAMWVGVLQIAQAMRGVPSAPSGDARALTWLAESDAAMNQVTSVRLLRTTRGESGAVLTESVRFQAPNLFHDQMSNGAENMAQGRLYFYRQPGAAQWEAVPQLTPFAFPDFDLSQQAVNARLGWREDVEGRPTQQVLFTVYLLRDPVPFARWIDVETKLILREVMDAPGHYMVSLYHDFNAPLTIILPAASDIMPTSTLTRPAAP